MRLQRVGTVVAVAVLLSVAGCGQLLTQEETAFVAGEATVTPTDAETAAFSHNASSWQNVTRSVEAAGQEREITVSNRGEVFLNRTADGTPAAAFAVVSSPQVELAGQELSPVAEWSPRDLLAQFGGQFDQFGTLTDIEERETRPVTMLGTEADMRVFNATLETDTETEHDVVVTVVRVKHDGDYVVAIGIRGLNGTDLGATDGAVEALVRDVEH